MESERCFGELSVDFPYNALENRMIKWMAKRLVDPLLLSVGRRIEWLNDQQYAVKAHCAVLGENVIIVPGGGVVNQHGDPKAITIGAYSRIAGNLMTFWDAGEIHIGESCYLGDGSRVWSQASVRIGNYCLISHLVDIHDTNSHPIDWQERRLDAGAVLKGTPRRIPTQTKSRPIVIEDDVWIGFKATILKGVHIGRGSIIAANSVVTCDVPPWAIVAGNPAVVVRTLSEGEK
ncbi:MAG: hypothetical protein QOH96_385 [Blastocatellia bacterium]|nr:hypothetical protein [Blastocatellia bacterium]